MKPQIDFSVRVLLMAFIITFLFSNCKKDDVPDTPTDTEENTISAKIGNVSFISNNAYGVILPSILSQTFNITSNPVIDGSNIMIVNIVLTTPIGGTLDQLSYENNDNIDCDIQLDACLAGIGYTVTGSNGDYTSGNENGNANVTFTKMEFMDDGTAIGTFSGTLINDDGESVQITEGKFNVPIGQ